MCYHTAVDLFLTLSMVCLGLFDMRDEPVLFPKQGQPSMSVFESPNRLPTDAPTHTNFLPVPGSGVWGFFVWLVWFYETGSCPIAQAGLELKIFLLQPPQCWDYRHDHHALDLFWILTSFFVLIYSVHLKWKLKHTNHRLL
jgi:hypothetical protein